MNFEKDDDTCCSSWADYPGPSWSLTKTCLHQGWGGPGGRPAEIISVTSRGIRPGITQGKAAKQRRRKQSLWPTAFSILSTRRNTWCFLVSFLWTFSGLMSAPIFLHGICRFRYFLVKILFSFYGCFQSNQILGFLSHFPKSAACSPSMYRPENIFFC